MPDHESRPSQLFRQQVIIARRQAWIGGIRLQAPVFGWLFCVLGMSAVVVIGLLLCLGHYTRSERADGILVPDSGMLAVTSMTAGIVVRALVQEGASVKAGQPLFEISGEQASASLGATHAAVVVQLQLKRIRLQSDLKEQERLTGFQSRDIRDRIDILQEQIAQLQEQTALQQRRADNAQALYEQWSGIGATGVVSRLQILQQSDLALGSQAQVKELRRNRLELKQQQRLLQEQLDELPATALTKHNDIERELADIAQTLAAAEAQRAVVLSAPADGTVSNVMIHAGQPVGAQQTLMTILPAHALLQAELWLPSRAIGFVHSGARVLLRYDAYPFQEFGQQAGRVREISRSALDSAELSKQLGTLINEPRYRVLVDLDSQTVSAYGNPEHLKPGMALAADVLLDRRRLIDWVLVPLNGVALRARGDQPVGGSR